MCFFLISLNFIANINPSYILFSTMAAEYLSNDRDQKPGIFKSGAISSFISLPGARPGAHKTLKQRK